VVWCTKYRKKLFEREEVRERAKQMVGEICEAYDVEILEMELMEEHIHLLVSFPPSRSIGEVVRILKSQSGRGLFREFPGLKKRLWGGEVWEDGYFVRTVGDRMTRDVIAKYIEHHRELEQGPAQLALKLRS
jgi:putative transposase